MNLHDNTVLITGGSSGIGLALAKKFMELGNTVIITGRNPAKLDSVKSFLPAVDCFCGDLTDQNALRSLVDFIGDRHENLNILVNNAAVQFNYQMTDSENILEKINEEISVNLMAPIKLTACLLPLLMKNQNSAVVNVSSGLAISPKKSAPVYCATKAAIHSFSKTLRYQLDGTPIRVYEIIPPVVDTPMTEGRGKGKISPEKLVDEFFRYVRSGRTDMYIGKSRLLKLIQRISPGLADRIMRDA